MEGQKDGGTEVWREGGKERQRIKGRRERQRDRRTEGWRDGGTEGQREGDGWMDEGRWRDEGMKGWRDGGMDGGTEITLPFAVRSLQQSTICKVRIFFSFFKKPNCASLTRETTRVLNLGAERRNSVDLFMHGHPLNRKLKIKKN
jgi:hypothetical protein